MITLRDVLIILLILILIGGFPVWGWWPSGGIGLLVLILIILALLGKI